RPRAKRRSHCYVTRSGSRAIRSGSISSASLRMSTRTEGLGLRCAVEKRALLQEALRNHAGKTLHHQITGTRILAENRQQRFAVDVEEPALLQRNDGRDTARLVAEQRRPAEYIAGGDNRALRRRAPVSAEDEAQSSGGDHVSAASGVAD